MRTKEAAGHICAIVTIVIWGTTFISTKLLLEDFQPVEILFFRFIIGFITLLLLSPHRLKSKSYQEELTFAMAGLCGICLYYLLENIALTYTMASNVGVIISVAPFFTAMLTHLFTKEKALHLSFFIGFLLAMLGICLISFQGAQWKLNPIGDLLAVLAALVWAMYALLTKRITQYGYAIVPVTRRIFFYGLLWMLPVLLFTDVSLDLSRFQDSVSLWNILFLGLGASALCFVTWNTSVKLLGAIRTSIYIYMVPVITVFTSFMILHEKITWLTGFGVVLILFGLGLSEYKKKGSNHHEY